MNIGARWLSLVAIPVLAACSPAIPPPAQLDTKTENCAFCRMTVSDRHFAAQIVARGEEPLFFDDLGCLHGYLGEKNITGRRVMVYVADHRSGDWAPASSALFSRQAALETPMASHLIAHANDESLRLDPAAQGAVRVSASEVLGPAAEKGKGP